MKCIALALVASLWTTTIGRELHPGLTVKRDWSKTVHQFNLHKHLTNPTAKDRREGVDKSRRLARNAIKLGIDNETHRKLVADNPPANIIQEFDQTSPLPSEGPRVSVDGTSDALPFGDGPGYMPAFPTGTNAFWEGDDGPEAIWEIVACPVADVESFLENPLRCVFGGDDGSLLDLYSTIDGSSIEDAMTNAIVPIAVEFIYNFSGLGWLIGILENVCEILRIVDLIDSAVDALGDFWDSTTDVENAWWNPTTWFRELQSVDEYDSCTGHMETCNEDPPAGFADCSACLESEETVDCVNCRTCFQPLYHSVTDMEGVCMSTNAIRSLFTAPAPSLPGLHGLYTTLTARYLNKNIDEKILQAILDSEAAIKTNTDEAETSINQNIDNTCSASERRLRETDFDAFIQSEQAQAAKQHAKSQGLKDDDIDRVFSRFLNRETGHAFDDRLRETLKTDFSDPKKMEFIDAIIDSEVESNRDKYTGKLVHRLLRNAADNEQKKLDVDKLRDTIDKLRSIKVLKQRNLGLVEDCEAWFDSVKDFIKEDLLEPLVSEIVSALASLGGSDSVFQKVLDDPVYFNALEDLTNPENSPLLMSFGFVEAFDPWSDGGVLQTVMSAIVDIFQTIVGFFLYGCDINDDDCGDLPSLRNEVLPIKETRSGTIHMASGCDSEFEGELAWYSPALDIIDKLLDAAGDAVIEFLNIPIKIVQFILQAASKLFSHMNDVCSYLDEYVQLALVEATHENSRFALQELACRQPYETGLQLQKGYGCDGLDNDCDDDKQIDECEEDIFPPDIDASQAILFCSSKYHASGTEAESCFRTAGLVTAADDCKPTRIDFGHTDNSCSADVSITATAEGCGERSDKDITVLLVEGVKVDGDPPHVECAIGAPKMTGNGAGVFTDLQLSYVAYDTGGKCTSTQELEVTVEVLSNEVVETGEEMVSISKPAPGTVPSVWVENAVCNTGSNGKCKISGPKKSRLYVVQVTATDDAGNTATGECSTVVGNQAVDPSDPLFTIATLEMVGGVDDTNAVSPVLKDAGEPRRQSKGRKRQG